MISYLFIIIVYDNFRSWRPREEDLQGDLKKKKTFKDDTGHYKSCEGGAQARNYKQSLEVEGMTYSPPPL